MSHGRLGRIFLPPSAGERVPVERTRSLATMRAVWVAAALGLDVSLYFLLRNASALRPEVVRLFAFVNIGLMGLDLGVTLLFLRRPWRGYRPVLWACVVCEALAAIVWIQMTGSVSSYFLIVGFLLVMLYRMLFDYVTGLVCALAVTSLHCGAFVLETVGVLRPASIFVAVPLGIYEIPMFRLAALISLVVGYVLTFVAINFFVSTLREKDAALRSARRDLARVADDTTNHGRLCGQVLADCYELQELIGRGGMGDVYQGLRLDDGERVAVKVMHAHLVDDEDMRERFRREAEMVALIPAAHVAKVLECGVTEGGQHFIVMEHLRGEDLASVLRRRGQIPVDELVPLVDKISLALEAAHAVGVVHRDLKPENVFVLDGGGEIRLLDFGIARMQEGPNLTLLTDLLGTPGYMAPEQARGGTREIGPHTDVFALGAIVYRALTGKCAFPSRATAAAVYEAIHLIPPAPTTLMPDLSEDIDHVLTLALAKRWADRYPRPSLLAHDLRLASHGELNERSRSTARDVAVETETRTTARIAQVMLH